MSKPSKPTPKKPETPAEWCAYRCQLSCKVGLAAMAGDGAVPCGLRSVDYAIYNLLHAVSELSQQVALSTSPAPVA